MRMAPTEQALALYRAAAGAYRHTRRVLRAQPHYWLWAAAGAMKALRPDLCDENAFQEAAKAMQRLAIGKAQGQGRVKQPENDRWLAGTEAALPGRVR